MARKPTNQIATLTNALREIRTLKNTLTDLMPAQPYSSEQISNLETLYMNNRYSNLTINRNLLSFMYCEHGILQTAIDQPVQDALRGGVEITSQELDTDDIKELQDDMENLGTLAKLRDALIWKRLFGGGGIIINMIADPTQPFKNEPSKNLDFYAVDRWELTNPRGSDKYVFYGTPIHHTRVIEFIGKTAPSMLRYQLGGWGMSEVERMVRDVNAYFKNKDVIFELLDEAKIDVYKIKGFNTSLMSSAGTAKINARIEGANYFKSYKKAVVLDKEDDYDQKNLSFSGLAEMLKETRIGIASALKMPMTKIFGLSASGFNSGEDDLENYNAMVESDVRESMRQPLRLMISMHMMKLWGFVPQFDMNFKPLRVMSEKDEEDIKRSRQDRVVVLYDRGLLNSQEVGQAASAYDLLPMQSRMEQGGLPEQPATPGQTNMQDQFGAPGAGDDAGGAGDLPPAKGKKPEKPPKGEKPEVPE